MKRNSLRTRLTALVAIFILLTVAILGIVLAWSYAYDRQQRLTSTLAKELEIVSYATSAGLEFDDAKTVEESVALLKNVREFVEVKVLNRDGKIFAQRSFSHEEGMESDDTFLVETPIFNAVNVQIGKIKALATARYFKKDLFHALLAVLVLSLLVTAIALFLVTVFLRRFFKPLAKLKEAIDGVAGQGFIGRVDIESNDEVGDLASSFNAMSGALQKTTVSRDALLAEIELRQKTEGVLREREKTISAISDSAQDAILMMDSDEKISFWNPAAEHIFGWTKEEASGQQFHVFVAPEQYTIYKNSFADYLTADQSTGVGKTLELKGIRKDKTEFPFAMSLSALELGGQRHVSGIIRDITEAKKREEDLRQAVIEAEKSREIMVSMLEDNSKIRKELEKTLEGLKEAHSQLAHAEKMEAIGQMASGVAHEVKNPLGIILQAINFLEASVPEEQVDNHKMIQIMKASLKRADSIVRGLLDFARGREPVMELQDINSIIESSLELVQHRFKVNGVESECDLKRDLPPILLDRGKMEQVLVILFTNAADAMPKGGKIWVRTYLPDWKNLEKIVGKRQDDFFKIGEGCMALEVKDSGGGISKDILGRIFDPFFTTKKRTEGTGLGLSVAKSLIEMHNGMVHVESEEGKGTKFTIILQLPKSPKTEGKK